MSWSCLARGGGGSCSKAAVHCQTRKLEHIMDLAATQVVTSLSGLGCQGYDCSGGCHAAAVAFTVSCVLVAGYFRGTVGQ